MHVWQYLHVIQDSLNEVAASHCHRTVCCSRCNASCCRMKDRTIRAAILDCPMARVN